MSDRNETTKEEILSAVSTLFPGGNKDASVIATERGWLSDDGEPTESGKEFLRALKDQDGTRSVFRPF